MASARKQEHLEAGKRRLEEFRKKKAAERAKKSANHLHTVNADGHDVQPIDYQHEILTDSNGAVTSDRVSEAVLEPSRGVFDEENKTTDFVQTNEIVSNDIHSNPTYYNTFSTEIAQAPTENKDFDRHHGLWPSRIVDTDYPPYPQEKNDYSITVGVSGRHGFGFASDQSVSFSPQDDGNSTQPSHDGSHESYLKDTDGQLKDYRSASPATSRLMVANFSPENSGGIQLLNNSSYGSLLDSGLTLSSNEGERKRSNSFGLFPSGNSTTFWSSESKSTASATGPSSDYPPFYQAVAETNGRRSRPSFLDSIDLPRIPRTEPGRVDSISSKVQDVNVVSSSTFGNSHSETERVQPFSRLEVSNEPSAFEHSMFSSFPAGNGNEMFRDVTNNHSKEGDSGFYLQKQDEDFAALEQHIEDLTQEKFSLQRALEASRTLADSLAAENSSLTDSYNQQGSTVNQLKSEMERLQEEIKAQLVELESVKMEYANAQLECTAADERAKLLASEVISLEEKALRLRSSELKLERQLENSQAEFSSFKKKLSSLEKDRQDLQSTIDALREEKKLLQAKLRKASANTKFVDAGKSLNNQKHVSTSTEDLFHEDDSDAAAGTSNLETHSDAILLGTNSSFSSLLPENGQFNLEVLSSSIPSDQLRMIQNINTLVSELALEKEELMQALLAESLESSKLKESNKELFRKLEVQTQRLELLAAQNMANENFPIRQPDPRGMPDNTPYADEGDEVVERVLGWIMKFFPGGPSRRRTSKLI